MHSSQKLAKGFVELFGLEMSKEAQAEEVMDVLGTSLEAVLINITAVACLVALIHERKKVLPEDLKVVAGYVQGRCHPGGSGEQRGGSPFPSDYFGYPHPSYNEENLFQGTVTSQIDFGANLARAALPLAGTTPGFGTGLMMGGAHGKTIRHLATHSQEAAHSVRRMMRLHGARASKTAMATLLHLADIHFNCLAEDLVAVGPLTLKKVQRVLGRKRHQLMQ